LTSSIRPLSRDDLTAAATVHAACFPAPWKADVIAEYLAADSISLGAFSDAKLRGFILLGACTDQSDIVTLAVIPAARRQNLGRALVSAAEEQARRRGVELIFLEVAKDNLAAAALYKSCGYVPIGQRKNYYRRAGGRVSAVTMRKNLS
jgi:ribosomal-protein-alanine N-acetyltransferase